MLTCIGICMYERLHRIYMRMKEEECTCQVFAAVAVDALWRSFETAVESKQGISQLELLYAEITREEQQKQLRKEQKKLKRKRKKERLAELEGKENCIEYDDGDEFDDKDELEKDCTCTPLKNEPLNCLHCDDLTPKSNCAVKDDEKNCKKICTTEIWVNECKCDLSDKKGRKNSTYKCDSFFPNDCSKKENGNSSDHSHDCGYSSENNNGCCETGSLISSLPSSPEGSEVACSESCCQQDYMPFSRFPYGNGHQLSLQEMLEVSFKNNANDYGLL